MPTYEIDFVGGNPSYQPMTVHCVDDAQVMRWALGFLGGHSEAHIWEGARPVGMVSFAGTQLRPDSETTDPSALQLIIA
jgi:hypothetical protein